MKNKLTYIYLIFMIGIVFSLVKLALYNNESRLIKGIEISVSELNNVKFLNVDIVNKIVVKKFKKKLADTFNYQITDSIEKELNKHPFIKNAEVFISPDKKLNVNVKQKTPIARVQNIKGDYYITEAAKKVNLSTVYAANVMLIHGKVETKDFPEIVDFIHYIKKDTLLNKQVIGIRKQEGSNYLLITKVGGHFVEVGKLSNLDKKFINLKAFYSQYLNYTDLKKYKKISLKYNNQIVCTKR